MVKNKILFVCSSLQQAKMMHEISKHLYAHNCYFTFNYCDGLSIFLSDTSFLSNKILGRKSRKATIDYFTNQNITVDSTGDENDYDIVLTCNDLAIPPNIKSKTVLFIQDIAKDTENFLDRTGMTFGLSHKRKRTSSDVREGIYTKYCVSSEGFKTQLINKGITQDKIAVTGIPGFDNYFKYIGNNFPHKNFVLVATSDNRETYNFEDRQKFIYDSIKISEGRKLIFKLHPNENFDRAIWEINNYAPGSLIFSEGDVGEMIANCDVLITKSSSLAFIGITLNKEVHSAVNIENLKQLLPIQNNGISAMNIASEVEETVSEPNNARLFYFPSFTPGKLNFIQRYRLRQKLPTTYY